MITGKPELDLPSKFVCEGLLMCF